MIRTVSIANNDFGRGKQTGVNFTDFSKIFQSVLFFNFQDSMQLLCKYMVQKISVLAFAGQLYLHELVEYAFVSVLSGLGVKFHDNANSLHFCCFDIIFLQQLPDNIPFPFGHLYFVDRFLFFCCHNKRPPYINNRNDLSAATIRKFI